MGLANEFGGTLSDDDANRHGVAGCDVRHDRRIRIRRLSIPCTLRVPSTTDMASRPILAVQD